ncbi:shikimate dehydrogenase [Alkalilimnicola sp. S0819]|uniref:shikimate dehydrogenase n=1 Tax=Alkalilimnicola sp. S0819 TaxID=2613922 RepID=UPI001262A896|nr:shikimate dehydrogenase [Alkalilimnicola sp. S0819]KAB7624400.1 shikimate dehydrogenase [Alkalilimnicola sp. S0819]MPQ16227.1 shikimate dehydrogenase [Alkalilimnicola sp. S0819]
MDRYAVIGNPIAHSRSPRIHDLFAEQCGQAMRYEKLLAPLDAFEATVRRFLAEGGRGLNVTVPFKQQAWALSDARSERAERSGAVNTLALRDDGTLYGDNTDGVGLVRDLHAQGAHLGGRRLLLLGAGGAARGVMPSLLAEAPARILIANRTPARAEELAAHFQGQVPVQGMGYPALAGETFDIVINATSAGLSGELPPLPEALLAAGAGCYDMVYAAEPTAFVRWARARNAGFACDGLGMLVEQAAESFRLWRGAMPDTAPVIALLRREMAA